MRDYLSPAIRYVSRVISHPGTLGTFVVKRKHLSFAIAASFVVITTLGFVTVKGIMQNSTYNQDAVNKNTDLSINTTVTTDNLPTPTTPVADNSDQTNYSSSTSSQTTSTPSVTVNNQSIPLPANGSVSKTIQSNDATTDVNITVNSSNDTSSSSTSSTNLQVNTNTFSHKTESHSQ